MGHFSTKLQLQKGFKKAFFPGAEWCTTSDHTKEPSKDERRRRGDIFSPPTKNFIPQKKGKEVEKEGERKVRRWRKGGKEGKEVKK